jgi:hypothetical protein
MGPQSQPQQQQAPAIQQQAQNIDLSLPIPANNPEDQCPICGEYSYLEMRADLSAGGTYGKPVRMCLDCHGPGGGTSQGVVKSGSAVVQNVSGVESLKVRESGGFGSWALQDKSQADGSREAGTSQVPLIR